MDGGVSPLETLRKLLEEEAASTNHRAAYWKNAARQSGWIERPLDAPEWSEPARKRFREDMESTMAGAANAGRIGVLEEGMSWNGTAFSPRESEQTESRELTYKEVTRVYGIPFALIGALSDSKSNVESFHRQLYQDVLAPWLRFLESEIELQLLPDFETDEVRRRRIYVEFNLMAKLAGSFEEQGKTLVTAVGVPYMTANEARARLNLPSIDDEAFDEPVKPLNVLYGGQPAPTVPTEDPGTPPTLVEAASRDAELKAAEVKRFEDALVKYFERHERDVLSKAGQNGNHRPMFSTSRLWDRDLALHLFNWAPHLEEGRAELAKAINDVTYDELREELEAEGDPKTVFAHAKEQRAAEIACKLAGVDSHPLAPKHLPGEHDQDRHGGEGGSSSGLRIRNVLNTHALEGEAASLPGRAEMSEVIEAMSGLHSVSNDAPIDVVPTSFPGENGAGEFRHRGVTARGVSVNVTDENPHIRTTLAHELGHWIDHQQVGDKGFESKRAALGDKSSPMADWWAAVQETDAMARLQKVADTEILPNGILASPRYVSYLQDPSEIWARTYAQWVASRTSSQGLKDEMSNQVDVAQETYSEQWDDDDFEPVAQAIDRMMKGLGWLPQS
jgi:hypothetical protein